MLYLTCGRFRNRVGKYSFGHLSFWPSFLRNCLLHKHQLNLSVRHYSNDSILGLTIVGCSVILTLETTRGKNVLSLDVRPYIGVTQTREVIMVYSVCVYVRRSVNWLGIYLNNLVHGRTVTFLFEFICFSGKVDLQNFGRLFVETPLSSLCLTLMSFFTMFYY